MNRLLEDCWLRSRAFRTILGLALPILDWTDRRRASRPFNSYTGSR